MATLDEMVAMKEASALASKRSVAGPLLQWVLSKRKFTYQEAGIQHNALVEEGLEGLSVDTSLEEWLGYYVDHGLLRLEWGVYTLV
ncbi:hypothetical protein A2473_00330 [candidate division WWE3 bacterium RIFOXYC2_FULL_42_13]|uniref:Uncharacterized protein n=1 Tax=candidate division WWE3 bacterium TaxID=2053526 RepID=A0A3D0ZNU3_UNCKA|nr:MAG: hypothetical protein A2245_02080 [candidate division WWE3 bacterium RIFOXYA2_FULL_43_12]OGC64830.1 MAG: hypothetical protein A2274_03525 [candidate division WWE3 bacterium RIFOXYA12_FULL_43_11]OGC73482.1 MAG: hypothetical protein A2337_04155 [candidate division WWE3 bacterium RIFOXYB2_FULL_43_9]OGC74072.1 MAG: hypothetical protein A2473_00330 [candidate division WWE3 bacterium RIFOXYC2_FULL_42_13]OGC74691.1 MAG: hypothetical protein A2547_00125 [candidate division WWE3 bacterium RIFOXYD